MKLFLKAIFKYLLGVLLVGILVFVPAGEFYFNGILFMLLLFVPMLFVGIYLMIKNHDLLERRLNAKENEKEQRTVIVISALMFITGFIVSGLCYRYSFWVVPKTIVIISSFIFLFAYLIYFIVLIENDYLYRTIKVENDQKLIDNGLYGIVRHPMYGASIILFLMMPLILGSWISFVIFLVYPIIISKRIENEEKILEKDLKGYKEYKKKVKYKVIPYVW